MGKPNPLGTQATLGSAPSTRQEQEVPPHFGARPVETLTHPSLEADSPPVVAQGT
jgi:hypothetical protein